LLAMLDFLALLLFYLSPFLGMSLVWGWVVQQGTLRHMSLRKMHKLGHHI
jgi:hypothetical protein